MPLSEVDKLYNYKQRGFSPDDYDIVEDEQTGSVSFEPKNKLNPSPISNPSVVSGNTTAQTPKYGNAQTFGMHAASGVVPGTAGLLGGIGAAALASAPLEAVPPPFGQILHAGASLVGGLASAYGASKLQEAILPDSANQALAQSASEHPYTALGGNLAGQMVTMRPSSKALGSAYSGLRSLLMHGEQINPVNIANLANTGIGAGIGAGQSIYDDVSQGKPIDPINLAMNATGGGLLNSPTRLGRMLPGVHATQLPVDVSNKPFTVSTARPLEGYTQPVGPLHPEMEAARIKQENETKRRVQDFQKAKQEVAHSELELATAGLEQQVNANRLKAEELRTKPVLTTANNIEVMPDYTGNMEHDASVVAQESPEDLQMRKLEGHKGDRYQEEVKPQATVDDVLGTSSKPITPKAEVAKVEPIKVPTTALPFNKIGMPSESVTSRLPDMVVKNPAQARLLRKESITPELETLPKNPITGATRQGVADVGSENRRVGLDPAAMGDDTIPHETAHHTLVDMLQSSDSSVSGAAKKWLMIHGWDGKSTDVSNPSYAKAEEALVSRAGKSFNERSKESSSFKTFAKDLVASAQSKFGSKSNTEAAGRMFANSLENSPTFTERANIDANKLSGNIGKGTRNQELDERDTKRLKQLEDYEDRRNLTVQEETELQQLRRNSQGKRFQEQDDKSNVFATSTEKLLDQPNVLKMQHDKDGNYDSKQLLGRISNSIPPAELNVLNDLGFSKHLEGKSKISGNEVKQWLAENAPKVEVHSYGQEGKVSKAREEYDLMKHEWFDNLTPDERYSVRKIYGEYDKPSDFEHTWKQYGLSSTDKSKVAKYVELWNNQDKEITNNSPRATSAYNTVSPKSTKTHPIVRVDVVIPQGKNRVDKFGEKFPEFNLWTPDGLHENLPNTLGWAAIQYHTFGELRQHNPELADKLNSQYGHIPDDAKIAHIFELQSRWGQHIREMRKGEGKGDNAFASREQLNRRADSQDHPLLKDYNRLILKAAIEQARKDGATHIAISDGETAMMSEGHDAHVSKTIEPTEKNIATAERLMSESDEGYHNTILLDISKGGSVMSERLPMKYRDAFETSQKVSQEQGMRLNYDKILPKIAEELTGSKGEPINFGEHKNAKNNGLGSQSDNFEKFRDNLIFKNENGTPKTDVTARMYDISTPANQRAEGEPFSLFGKRYQEQADTTNTKASDEPTRLDKIVLGGIGSSIDKIRNVGKPSFKYVGDKLDNWFKQFSYNKGEYVNKLQSELEKYTKQERANVDSYGRRQMLTNGEDKSITLTDKEQELHKTIRDYLVNVADANEARLIKKNPNYWPAIADINVINDLVKSKGNYLQYRQDFLEHIRKQQGDKYSKAHAIELLNKYIAAVGSRGHGNNDNAFGALRKVAGYGLPESMQDNNLLSRYTRYGNRVAKDLASQTILEKDPIMRKVLHLPDSQLGKSDTVADADIKLPTDEALEDNVGEHPAVQNAMKFMYNDFVDNSSQPKLLATARLLGSTLMGTGTAARNIAATPLNTIGALNEWKDLPKLVHGLVKSFDPEIWRRSFESNARQKNINSLEFGATKSPDKVANFLNRASDIMRKLSGREASEHGERIFEFAVGDLVARQKLLEAGEGNKKSINWLEKHGSIVDGGIEQYYGDANPPEEVMNKLAKSFVDRASGTYDARGLPAGAMEGQFAPYLALSRWNIEKANVIYKDVVKQAISHNNYMPLLSYTLGALVTGEGIRKLNELMSGKKANEASLEEATAMGNKDQQVKAVVSLMQMASYGGIVSDIAKTLVNPNKSRELSFPLADFITDNLGKNIGDAREAIAQGANKFDTVTAMLEEIISSSVQGYRLANSRFLDKEDTDRKNKFRDIRVFNELEGKPVNSDYAQPNKFIDTEAKAFKKSSDIGESASQLSGILKQYFTKYSDNPEQLRAKLNGLKANNYQTMPSPEHVPATFIRYLNYVKATQGESAASNLFVDYMLQNAKNKMKSSMVPSL